MPKLGTYGSVRGALSNGRPYRDSTHPTHYAPTRVLADTINHSISPHVRTVNAG